MSDPRVLVMMGSDSDLPVMAEAAKVLTKLEIGHEVVVLIRRSSLIFIVFLWYQASTAATSDATDPVVQALANRLEEMQTLGSVQVQDTAIAGRVLLPAIYAGQEYRPLWTDPDRVREAIELVRTAPEDGLILEDYLVDQVEAQWRLAQASQSPLDRANLDLILTESIVRYGYHQLFGKVNATELDSDVNFTRKFFAGREPADAIPEFIASPMPLATQLRGSSTAARSIGA